MKKLLILLLIAPITSKAQIEKELILNSITIDSIKFDLVSFSYSNGPDLMTDESIIATNLKWKKYETENDFDYPWVTYLKLSDKKEIKRLKSEIKEVKKFKDISFKKNFNVVYDVDDTTIRSPIQITYNVDGDYKFRILTLEEVLISIPFDLASSIKYGRYFGGDLAETYEISYYDHPLYLETDLDGMEKFIKFLENK
jgi:hypothetical protein